MLLEEFLNRKGCRFVFVCVPILIKGIIIMMIIYYEKTDTTLAERLETGGPATLALSAGRPNKIYLPPSLMLIN